MIGEVVLGRKGTIGESLPRKGDGAERSALRELLNSFDDEPERLLERTLHDPMIRKTIGKFIGHTFVKPYAGEK
jgi:hypothetical protein